MIDFSLIKELYKLTVISLINLKPFINIFKD